jgi:outer membrane receptor protein involved in Fe transport
MPFRESRDVPVPWLPGNAVAVGLTAPDYAIRVDRGEGPYAEHFNDSGFNPQITMRFRATDDMTVYARYAKASKIGGFDTGQTSIPTSIDELTFQTEDATQYEIGVKGNVAGGRVSYDVDFFQLEIPNLQVSGLSPDPNQTSASFNAGQRARGIEFNTRFAATENLLFGLSGVFMKGEMTSYPGAGCTDAEIQAALSNANAPCQIYDGSTRIVPPPDIDPLAVLEDYTAIINRSGYRAPRSPDWKFVLTGDYYVPLSNGMELNFSAKGYVSDGYITDVEGFSEVVKYDQHSDLNLMVGLRNADKGWGAYVYARNLLEARPTYHPELDPFPDGLASAYLSPSSFTTYGVRLEYTFD